jgi:hypothetical protein
MKTIAQRKRTLTLTNTKSNLESLTNSGSFHLPAWKAWMPPTGVHSHGLASSQLMIRALVFDGRSDLRVVQLMIDSIAILFNA